MEPATAPETKTPEKSAVEMFVSIMGKMGLVFLLLFVGAAVMNSAHDPAMNHTGGGVVKMSIPLGTTSCMVTVQQDDGTSHAYDKLAAPYCIGFSVGKRVHVTNGMVD